MGKIRNYLEFGGLACILAFSGCRCNSPVSKETRQPYSAQNSSEENYANYDLMGFGKLERLAEDKFPIAYKTESGEFIGKLGAKYFVVDSSGKVLTRGSHRITKLDDSRYLTSTGNNNPTVEKDVPKDYMDFKDYKEEGIDSMFEKRKNGIYVKGWKN